MLTEAQQDEVVVRALAMGQYRRRLQGDVARGVMTQRRADQLWRTRVDQFKDFLKELGDVPMPGVQIEAQQVVAAQKAHESNGTQVV